LGDGVSDTIYGLQFVDTCGYNGFDTAKTIQKPTGPLATDSRQSLQYIKLPVSHAFWPIAVSLKAAAGHRFYLTADKDN
jgi:hypothetical protein